MRLIASEIQNESKLFQLESANRLCTGGSVSPESLEHNSIFSSCVPIRVVKPVRSFRLYAWFEDFCQLENLMNLLKPHVDAHLGLL